MVHWPEKLRSPTLSYLPSDYTRPSPYKVVDGRLEVTIDGDDAAVLTALVAILYRLTGDEDILIGVNSPAPFVSRQLITNELVLQQLYDSVKQEIAEAAELPLDFADALSIVRAAAGPEASLPFTVLFASDSKQPMLPASVEGLNSDICFHLWDSVLTICYNTLLFKKERISVIAEQLAAILAADRSEKVCEIDIITESQKNVLPDPRRDLHWAEYRGSIQDIFTANAHRFPDRECIVETRNIFVEGSKSRIFTYGQINSAANAIAHRLIIQGLTIGDVVMIYAYRGVDLVIAVMGVLKAGCTFSVIDPAYPPARQNIYLSVAKPQGLLVLRKAGTLSEEVRQYIVENLSLKTQVENVELLDDGKVVGFNSVDNSNVLQGLPDADANVEVGPDCNPTLSFTSGSEGVPKGVKGRHFSLTYYFPWMAERFHLSEKDNFTMLSGIAHDPIQRDIFTPLFLGAKLLVPTQDDIGTPGRLAQWMSENSATVTHLTPAMGQLLSAQAEADIESLHHAFFVGDILTKRDCLRLQALAKNVHIVNMYGTTETQRAVSYFEIPSMAANSTYIQGLKDIMPAGQGMVDVQLLVVNRNNRQKLCGMGEVGEIYVRAGGLAEGYLQLPELTAEKFITSWFVSEDYWKLPFTEDNAPSWAKYFFGIRDRLYRTGDLGRYIPGGYVECSGRADSQVKIRGFRIELGEIDTHLSQHYCVRENVTLVRRDKDDEPTLVSYIVPHGESVLNNLVANDDEFDDEDDAIVKGLVKYRNLIKDIKRHLKQKLPSYAVPTVIVPLSKMPLNPNGKVDKPALPFPDTAQLSYVAKKVGATESGSFTPMQAEIRDIWLSVFPQVPSSVRPEDNFFELGGHSILATRMIFAVRKKYMIDLPLNTIFSAPTIAEFTSRVEALKSGDDFVVKESDTAENGSEESSATVDYNKDCEELKKQLLPNYVSASDRILSPKDKIYVLLTGATGFLGSFILKDVLSRGEHVFVYAHVRGKDKQDGLRRVKNACEAYGFWDSAWEERIEVLVGDLGAAKLGLSDSEWITLEAKTDVIIHNAALVHWVYPYSKLRAPNVLGTIELMSLCSAGKPKYFTFVSSTSTVDTDHFVSLSDKLVSEGKSGIPESDDLQGSAYGLSNGYGQSKWVAERLIRTAGARGLTGCIVRPGYVLGDSVTGATNTDDFLVRMLKGCIQLGLYPDIANNVNMVPVNHVARVVCATAFNPPSMTEMTVAHVTGHPRIRFNEFLALPADYGYAVKKADYVDWRIELENYVVTSSQDHALYPLLHFVLDSLPQNTRAPELDDTNACIALKKDIQWTGVDVSKGSAVLSAEVGKYLAYLVAIGFISPPPSEGKLKLPSVTLSEESLKLQQAIGGRGSAA
ncbi:hypothetical protein CANCADRAFT_1144 [Tortispora caseinolytica NRRL Y-17796]|uniref:Alpha-aminoadipate reductase n=1 Tax=Tortispora caseinolytica NRRL Y-17796 TaxID=767744 RepID=A0A1E4TLC7_9ASCO|nr:hypothetical protein CANCADRAFT_1144 [Tortispora caseinolytica NRRL Y-17796]